MQPSQLFTYVRTYSHWLETEQRRETWKESHNRYFAFIRKAGLARGVNPDILDPVLQEAESLVDTLDLVPSMRGIWAAGPAAERQNICIYNCSAAPLKDIRAFAEGLYILMCGAGFGFSVERRYINQLPDVEPATGGLNYVQVGDSKEGWADAVDTILTSFFLGYDVVVDVSQVRPKGARLKTMGGRASGPEPLLEFVDFARKVFAGIRKEGRTRIKSIECHDLMCKIADIVVVGGVRRSSLISLSDLDDPDMPEAKKGMFWSDNPQRAMANNSAVYETKPNWEKFCAEWETLVASGSGERGIFNREAGVLRSRKNGRRDPSYWEYLTNPCAEILLRAFGLCNLTEVIVRPEDNLDDLERKVYLTTVLGCLQATLTHFPYLRPEWAKNAEAERLLGVSLTGLRSHPVLQSVTPEAKLWLREMKKVALLAAEAWSQLLGIPMPAAVTAGKPSGTVSQLAYCASGCHAWEDECFIRRYRISGRDPLFAMMRDQGVPYHPEVGQDPETASTFVFEFPMKAPEGAVTRHHLTAIDQLEYWKMLMEDWCEHNQSITVTVRPEEWDQVRDWVWQNWESVCGISFLPHTDHVYQLAPFEGISKERYEELTARFPEIDYSRLAEYEQEDNTTGAQTYACVGGVCELVS